MFSLQNLTSGLPLLNAQSNGTSSVTVLALAGAGSRYESEKERGISHFLEHMFFKGGKKYQSTKEVSMAIDGVGGDFNAFTGKEYAGYYVKVAAGHIDLACDVMSDMLLCATFPKEEIEKERGVILEEERMYQDTPMYRAGWDFEELVFGDHPLGWDTIGKEKVILSVQQEDFQSHKKSLYTPDNMVLAFAGNIDPESSMKLGEQYFAQISGTKNQEFSPFTSYPEKKVFLRSKETEQAHLVLGVPSISSLDPDHFAHKLLAIILGGNMSSRMFLRIREAKGMCYYIDTDADAYLDAGTLCTRAGVDQSRLNEAIESIKHEYLLCAKDGVTEEELVRAKDYLKGKMTLSLEDSEECAHFYSKQQLLYPKTFNVDQYFEAINKVTKSQIDALAKKILTSDALRLVVIGKDQDAGKLEEVLNA
jgi:predicted Zn-dependent peptidase